MIKKRFLISFVFLILTAILLASAGCTISEPALSPAGTATTTVPAPAASMQDGLINRVVDTKEAFNIVRLNQSNPDFVILDVRTPEEFNSGHIGGAINIDIYSPDFEAKINALDRNKKYLVYCRTARRSAEAVKLMGDLEFKEVYDLAGGISQWVNDGYPAEK